MGVFSQINASQMQAIYTQYLNQYGESITMSRGGDDTTYAGICDHPSNVYLQQNFFDDDELVSLTQPVVAFYLDGTCSGTNNEPQILDTFTRDGRALTVRKVGVWRVNNTVILYLIMCD